MNKQVIVLGMHRSGTSILSKVLINLGVDMGEGDTKGGISNIDGHNEDFEMLSINEKILEKLNATWYEPPNIDDVEREKGYISSFYSGFAKKRSGFWAI